jgi:hypothetical protein
MPPAYPVFLACSVLEELPSSAGLREKLLRENLPLKRLILTSVVWIALSLCALAQSPKRFDTYIHKDNANIVIQPPPNTTWTLKQGSFGFEPVEGEEPSDKLSPPQLKGVGVLVYQHDGATPGVGTHLILINDLSEMWFVPVIDGYALHQSGELRGLDSEIVLTYPNRLVIHFSKLKTLIPTWTWVRFTIKETAHSPVMNPYSN